MSTALRDKNLENLDGQEYDVLIVGGGINGAVSAAALAGKGVRVALVDRGDFASGVSSNSSNLAWGGIKYLESREFLLVNKLCRSRNELMRAYPATVKEIRFFTTIQRGFRFWSFFVFLGSVLYWLMGRCKTRAPRYLSPRAIKKLEPEINTSNAAGGLEYSDCYLYDNDARFVFSFIRRALDLGCVAANYVSLDEAQPRDGGWDCRLRDCESQQSYALRAKVVINACGPWVDAMNTMIGVETEYRHLFSKGIHLIVDRVTDSRRVLTFFASDGRLFFLIPMGPKTCIGTTDTAVSDPAVGVTAEDRQFVLDNVNELIDLREPIRPEDVIAERVGVRPLAVTGSQGATDWVQLSRKHEIEINEGLSQISIFGGKLTDCLNVGEEIVAAVESLGITLPKPKASWYGEPRGSVKALFMQQASQLGLDEMTDPGSSEPLSERFWRRYGEAAFQLLDRIRERPESVELLIEHAEYTRCEIELTARREMVVRLEDFMRRRSKIEQVVRVEDIRSAPGLAEASRILFGAQAEERLEEYLSALF
ncbi:glycerol-3-phosphate dehydrogenase/oxidase [Congregibacter litoralis]|uniref:Glycerol-3-phosphate dehydrogenase n=1 Tax=Congregibacter litoralis KT71 TaxID=314285 RepID=A4AC64_9GAMM|nr:glycerol-3-phosphate dehydrogenase/oxidase [Congregibacter litoralis]EAQ96514.1 Glycerol-3-phosphate dehydrogenase [Congregibacter litoralis KT71]